MFARQQFGVHVFGALLVVSYSASYRPNIVVIVADDLGWNDVGFHGSDQVSTPNLDALAYNGVILNNHYVQPLCTPSRAALMSGMYPIHTGMQGLPILTGEPNGLPLTQTLMPQYFRELGYVTRAIGKWHLGFYRKEYLPQFRGFQSHFGIWGGFTSYYDYLHQDVYDGVTYSGFDLHRNTTPAWEYSGKYATDVFTEEAINVIQQHNKANPLFLYLAHLAVHSGNRGKYLEAPQEEVDKFSHIIDPNRRTYAAMVSKLDESVGRVVAALQNRYMLDNTIIVFMSDNGAASKDVNTANVNFYPNWGSNFPLRGAKETLWEGGVRSPTLIWSKQLQNNPRVYDGMIHITDWLPTLYRAAGGYVSRLPPYLDGKDQWNSISLGLPSVRNETLLNINEKDRNAALTAVYNAGSFYKQTWKIVYGGFKNNDFDEYYRDTRSPSLPPYNMTGVMSSLAHRALRTIHPPSSTFTMLSLRTAATLNCQPLATAPPLRCQTRPCLFDLERDPCETTDVAPQNPFITETLYDRLVTFRATLVPQTNQPPDGVRSDPRRHNNTWDVWSF